MGLCLSLSSSGEYICWWFRRSNILFTFIATIVTINVSITVPSKLSTMVATLRGWCKGTAGVRGSSWVVHFHTGHMVHLWRICFVQFFRWQGIAQSKSSGKCKYVIHEYVWTYFTSQSNSSHACSKWCLASWGTILKKIKKKAKTFEHYLWKKFIFDKF